MSVSGKVKCIEGRNKTLSKAGSMNCCNSLALSGPHKWDNVLRCIFNQMEIKMIYKTNIILPLQFSLFQYLLVMQSKRSNKNAVDQVSFYKGLELFCRNILESLKRKDGAESGTRTRTRANVLFLNISNLGVLAVFVPYQFCTISLFYPHFTT